MWLLFHAVSTQCVLLGSKFCWFLYLWSYFYNVLLTITNMVVNVYYFNLIQEPTVKLPVIILYNFRWFNKNVLQQFLQNGTLRSFSIINFLSLSYGYLYKDPGSNPTKIPNFHHCYMINYYNVFKMSLKVKFVETNLWFNYN